MFQNCCGDSLSNDDFQSVMIGKGESPWHVRLDLVKNFGGVESFVGGEGGTGGGVAVAHHLRYAMMASAYANVTSAYARMMSACGGDGRVRM